MQASKMVPKNVLVHVFNINNIISMRHHLPKDERKKISFLLRTLYFRWKNEEGNQINFGYARFSIFYIFFSFIHFSFFYMLLSLHFISFHYFCISCPLFFCSLFKDFFFYFIFSQFFYLIFFFVRIFSFKFIDFCQFF